MSAMSMITKLKVRTRLYLVFLSLIVVASLLAGVGSWGINRIGNQVVKLQAVGGSLERVLATKLLLEAMRRAQLRYMFDNDEASVKEMQADQAKAKELLAAAAANTLSEERLAITERFLSTSPSRSREQRSWWSLGRRPLRYVPSCLQVAMHLPPSRTR